MKRKLLLAGMACASVLGSHGAIASSELVNENVRHLNQSYGKAKNVIFFVGDGMGVSTVTATRIFSVGVDGELVVDQMPFVALSRTSTTDHITPDSAGTMTSMMSGENINSGVIGLDRTTERQDFNGDGDGVALWTVMEQAKTRGMKVGVVSTARITHATPAATYAHINDRNFENDIALQSLPGDATYNSRLGKGIDVLFGGGRRHFCPGGTSDEEGGSCSRSDGRDLRDEFQDAGYSYVWNQQGFNDLDQRDLPILGLFDRSHMKYEYDRPGDLGGEPSLSEMTEKAIDLLQSKRRGRNSKGYFLMVESGRIDHAHHATNAYRAMTETEEFDEAISTALRKVNLKDTLVVVTADHGHVFSLAGYPLRPSQDLPYVPKNAPADYWDNDQQHSGILDVVYHLSSSSGEISPASDITGTPYTVVGYWNGGNPYDTGAPNQYRDRATGRVDPRFDTHGGASGSQDPNYIQEVAVQTGSETHSAEEVAIYAAGPQSWRFQGTVKNSKIAEVMRRALRMGNPN